MRSARPSSNACSAERRRDRLTRTPSPAALHRPAAPGRPGAAEPRRTAAALAPLALAALILATTPLTAAPQAEPSHGPAAQAAQTPVHEGAAQAAPQPGQAEPQPAAHAAPQGEAHQAGGEHDKGSHEAASPWNLIGKIFNFAVLAGALVYLLRSPFADYLKNRAVRIRSDLANARQMRDEASAQMAKIEERLTALPSEIEALKRRGAAEAAAEQARMREATETERQRLLDQARREVESQVRTAERMLLKRAGELAVSVATERVRRTITAADQDRLVDRYLTQVGGEGVGAGN
ncbi:MAG: hypothetical protein EHM24_06915 [Acidobacteria bacterium]|nr:MAG: hypothetical protein EHM24_06915 [Acidobacteriota bacterium]